jgi:hypothetical protein
MLLGYSGSGASRNRIFYSIDDERVRNVGNVGVAVGLCIFVFAALIFYQSFDFSYYSEFGPGPGFFPLWLSGLLMVLSAVHIWHSLKKNPVFFKDVLPKSRELKILGKIAASVILFVVIVPVTGFTLASTLILFLLFYPELKWYTALGASVATTAVVFVTFQVLLHIPLPVSAIGL